MIYYVHVGSWVQPPARPLASRSASWSASTPAAIITLILQAPRNRISIPGPDRNRSETDSSTGSRFARHWTTTTTAVARVRPAAVAQVQLAVQKIVGVYLVTLWPDHWPSRSNRAVYVPLRSWLIRGGLPVITQPTAVTAVVVVSLRRALAIRLFPSWTSIGSCRGRSTGLVVLRLQLIVLGRGPLRPAVVGARG